MKPEKYDINDDIIPPRKSFARRSIDRVLVSMKEQMMPLFIALSASLGVGMGLILRPRRNLMSDMELFYLQFPGFLLLNMLKMLMVPLVVSSVVTSIAQLEQQQRSQIAGTATAFYSCTTAISVVSGILWVLLIEPGHNVKTQSVDLEVDHSALNALLSFILQCFPDNLVTAFFEKEVVRTPPNENDNSTHDVGHFKVNPAQSHGHNKNRTQIRYVREETNIIGLIFMSILTGVLLGRMGINGYPLKKLFCSINELVLAILQMIVWYIPVGLMFLVAGKVTTADQLEELVQVATQFVGTVLLGFFVHGFITLPMIFFVATGKNPMQFAGNQFKSILVAWGTSSSSAALPVTMHCLIVKNKLNEDIVRFLAPIGAIVNMDGTALYEAVASIFVAQYTGLNLTFMEVLTISLSSAVVSVGASGIPEAGLITVMVVLTSVGLPTDDITIILAFDWLLDRFRTSLNVWGDAIGAGILDHRLRHLFEEDEEEEDEVVLEQTQTTPPGEQKHQTLKEFGPALVSPFSLDQGKISLCSIDRKADESFICTDGTRYSSKCKHLSFVVDP